MRKIVTSGIVALASVALLFFGYQVGLAEQLHDFPVPLLDGTEIDKVLDGDTVVIEGEAIKVDGIDAPELGPWAKCWGEALAAGFAKDRLEEELRGKKYTIKARRTDGKGRISAKFVDAEGFELSNPMSVSGGAASTDGKWNWCSDAPSVVEEGTKPPHGPNLWWPANQMYDERAAD